MSELAAVAPPPSHRRVLLGLYTLAGRYTLSTAAIWGATPRHRSTPELDHVAVSRSTMCYDISRYNDERNRVTTYVISEPGCRRGGRAHFMSGRHGRGHGRHFGRPRPFGRRAGRGDIRAAILVLLGEQPMHGYQIIQELSERTGGVWQPSPGSVYPTLQQLQDEDLVRETASESGKRIYELTDAGREQADATTPPWTAVTDENEDALVSLRELAFQVMGATRQVARAGTASHIDAAQQILRDARQKLYRLLADEE